MFPSGGGVYSRKFPSRSHQAYPDSLQIKIRPIGPRREKNIQPRNEVIVLPTPAREQFNVHEQICGVLGQSYDRQQ